MYNSNNKGPKTDRCDSPIRRSSQLLKDSFILVLYKTYSLENSKLVL